MAETVNSRLSLSPWHPARRKLECVDLEANMVDTLI